jgi:hypothetical protein
VSSNWEAPVRQEWGMQVQALRPLSKFRKVNKMTYEELTVIIPQFEEDVKNEMRQYGEYIKAINIDWIYSIVDEKAYCGIRTHIKEDEDGIKKVNKTMEVIISDYPDIKVDYYALTINIVHDNGSFRKLM